MCRVAFSVFLGGFFGVFFHQPFSPLWKVNSLSLHMNVYLFVSQPPKEKANREIHCFFFFIGVHKTLNSHFHFMQEVPSNLNHIDDRSNLVMVNCCVHFMHIMIYLLYQRRCWTLTITEFTATFIFPLILKSNYGY